MIRKILIVFVALSISWVIAISRDAYAQKAIPAQWEQKGYLDRGKYLVDHLGYCIGCHTPLGRRGPNMSLYLSGVPAKFAGVKKGPPQVAGFRGPRGSRHYAKNITPDPETGIGKWSEDQFVRAFKEMRRPDGTRYDVSEMPWHLYKNMHQEDVRAMYRYLRTIKPIKNKVPENIPPRKTKGSRK